MKVTKCLLYICPLFLLVMMLGGCQRDDDEPRKAKKPISRLYVSTSEYTPNSADAQIRNVFVIDPADSSLFSTEGGLSYRSGALGGSIIHFSPFARSIFQSSMNLSAYPDTTIQVMSVNDRGQIAPSGAISNRKFDNVTGLWYNSFDDQLFAANLGEDTVSVFVINRPKTLRGFVRPAYQVMLNDRIWGMQLDSMDMLLSKTGVDGGILVFKNFVNVVNAKADTLVKDIEPTYRLTISGVNNIRGLSYAKASDILAVSDYYTSDFINYDGRVLIFENFSKVTANTTLTPTRVISGSSTNLQQPLAVAIDSREGGKYIYAADAKAKRIFRFHITDDGNVPPDAELSVGPAGSPYTPQSIFLDSRGPGEY